MNAKKTSLNILIAMLAIIIVALLVLFILSKTNILSSLISLRGHTTITLPEPIFQSKTSVEEALKNRRSIREYKNEPITMQAISQLLWAAQGITSPNGFRTAPSAGALYPLQIYLVSGNVQDLSPGVYRYQPQGQSLTLLIPGDKRAELAEAANKQTEVETAAADIIMTATFGKTIAKYGALGQRLVYLEAGCAAENILLQTVSLKIGSVPIGGFDEITIKKLLHLPLEEQPLFILPLGNYSHPIKRP